MAKIVPGGGVSEIRGKLGGSIFSRNQSGMYVRPYAVPVQPGTTPQLLNREFFQQTSAAWSLLLETQKEAWRSASAIVLDNLGKALTISGYPLYLYVNKNLVRIGAAQLSLPPADLSIPQLFATMTIDLSEALAGPPARKKVKLLFTPSPGPAGIRVVIWATEKTTLGRNTQKGRERIIFTSASAATSPIDATTAYENYFGQMATADIDTCKIFLKVVLLKEDNGMMTRGVAGGCVYGATKVILS